MTLYRLRFDFSDNSQSQSVCLSGNLSSEIFELQITLKEKILPRLEQISDAQKEQAAIQKEQAAIQKEQARVLPLLQAEVESKKNIYHHGQVHLNLSGFDRLGLKQTASSVASSSNQSGKNVSLNFKRNDYSLNFLLLLAH